MGLSCSGKTTLLNMISTIDFPTSGSILLIVKIRINFLPIIKLYFADTGTAKIHVILNIIHTFFKTHCDYGFLYHFSTYYHTS
jgi:ABC-type polysaccharide/polyol phosphate transport system ATPase subunit